MVDISSILILLELDVIFQNNANSQYIYIINYIYYINLFSTQSNYKNEKYSFMYFFLQVNDSDN